MYTRNFYCTSLNGLTRMIRIKPVNTYNLFKLYLIGDRFHSGPGLGTRRPLPIHNNGQRFQLRISNTGTNAFNNVVLYYN